MNPRESAPGKARYIMVGGFLGAGKTTAIARMARHLTDRGNRVGLITNDQGSQLVDTTLLRAKGFPVEEITGGCFCCRFDSLQAAAQNLTRETRPDVFIAEPVGSCTDLIATVAYPLRRIYGDRFSIAPLSVLIDPARAMRILGLEKTGGSFSEKVVYVYRKQLEEADAVFINKSDILSDPHRLRLEAAVRESFPKAEVFTGSARMGAGVEPWLEFLLTSEGRDSGSIDVDYDAYAEGEALLGWLNGTVSLRASRPFDANQALVRLARLVREDLARRGKEIAHLKLTLDEGGMLSVVSLVQTDGDPDLRESLLDRVVGGKLIINLRAEADPELLKVVVETAVGSLAGEGIGATWEHVERFRPARPVPTYRFDRGSEE
ncbi:MAG TPA: GTP-binding protein [Planctomycetota bacterium]|nr:GTP-binding protein [Planctomycetota bacterium]